MVDALHCLVFAPQVYAIGNQNDQVDRPEEEINDIDLDEKTKKKVSTYFSKLVCDNGEMIIPLTHILTH